MIVGMGDEGEVRRVFDKAAKLPSEDVRSDLTRWLLNNAREFAAGLAKERLPSWPRLSRALFELGIVNRRGGPVSPGTLRAAWYRTRLFQALSFVLVTSLRGTARGCRRGRRDL